MRYWFHLWRAAIWSRRLEVLTASVTLLERLDREYGSSYYSDKLYRDTCRKVEAAGAFKWHMERAEKLAPPQGC